MSLEEIIKTNIKICDKQIEFYSYNDEKRAKWEKLKECYNLLASK